MFKFYVIMTLVASEKAEIAHGDEFAVFAVEQSTLDADFEYLVLARANRVLRARPVVFLAAVTFIFVLRRVSGLLRSDFEVASASPAVLEHVLNADSFGSRLRRGHDVVKTFLTVCALRPVKHDTRQIAFFRVNALLDVIRHHVSLFQVFFEPALPGAAVEISLEARVHEMHF